VSLVCEHLSYTYSSHEGRIEALRDISCTVNEGECLAIIGHTGSGKSTLLQLMCGLISPTAGRVLLDGEDITSKSVRRRLHTEVGMAFQYPEYQLFAPTVAEDVGFAARNAGLPAEEVTRRVRLAMERVRLDYERYASLSPFELSGGEKRRVALAGVIATEPRILLLDEPAAGLDPAGRREMDAILKRFTQSGMGIVMVTHSMNDVARLAQRVLVLKDGSEVEQGTPLEIFARAEDLRAINLGVPQAEEYAATLREAGLPLPAGLLTLESLADALAALTPVGEGGTHGL
jgi:energy-coupling factor transport system ATP-binding protein